MHIAFQPNLLLSGRIHTGHKTLEIVTALLLGVIHGRIRVGQQSLDSRGVVRIKRDADAR